MPSGTLELTAVADDLLTGQGLKLLSCDILQKLWQGYGYVCRISAVDEAQNKQSLILKYVKPPLTGQVESEGHIRKIISYEVEQHFYSDLAPQLPRDAVVAQCLASINNNGKVALLLEDLQRNFPVAGEKRGTLNKTQVHAAIKWLATFHGFWWDKTPDLRNHGFSRLPPLEEVLLQQDKGRSKNGVWLNGGYTYLATRLSEYTSLCQDGEQSEWSTSLCVPLLPRSNYSIAQLVARILSPANGILRDYETLIHGDVKSENLFTNQSGDAVAFFDFQYVGFGCGLSDVAKLFTCSVERDLLFLDDEEEEEEGEDGEEGMGMVMGMGKGEERLLKHYQHILENVSGKKYSWEVLVMHWQTALIDWLRFQASWGFWGNTQWLEARARAILSNQDWLDWILDVTSTSTSTAAAAATTAS